MPGRLLEAMSSSPQSVASDGASANKRRSGRVVRKPAVFAPEPAGSAKRKRTTADDDHDDLDDEDEDESGSEEQEEDGPGDEELRHQKPTKAKGTATKQAPKRTKPNGTGVKLPLRDTAGKPRRPNKKVKAADVANAEEAGGLYTEVFARGHTLDDVVAQWLTDFDEHESRALADLVNFVLKSAGCKLEISEHDIADPDNCTSKLGDLQDEFQAVSFHERPTRALTYASLAKCHGLSSCI